MSEPNDHDVLIELRVLVKGLIERFDRFETGLASKADAARVDDLEKRVKAVEKQNWTIRGGLLVVGALIGYAVQLVAHWPGH